MRYSKRLVVVLFSGLLAVIVAAPRMVVAQNGPSLEGVMVTLPSGTIESLDTGGTGVPVLLLHPTNIRLWQYQVPAFAKAGYRVITIDSRNHAAGADPEPPGGTKNLLRIDELVVKLGLPKFHLLGTAGNGPLALQYARVHPDKVRSVVMSGTLGGLRDPEINALEMSLRPMPFDDMPSTFRYISASYRAANPEGTKRWLELDQAGRAAVAQRPLPAGVAPPVNADPLTVAKLEAWPLPTMLITGDADLYSPPSMVRIFVSYLKRGESAVIPESAHETYWENPEAYNRTVLRFIRKH